MKIACPNCGADIVYDISKQKVHCDHCNQDFDPSIMIENTKKYRRYRGYTCSSCGAELAVSEQEYTARCSYCKSQELIENNYVEELDPDGIIPFKYTKEEFIKRIKKHLSNHFLAPKTFKDGMDYKNISGLYVPAIMYEMEGQGSGFYSVSYGDSTKYYRCDFKEKFSVIIDANKTVSDSMMKNLAPYSQNDIVPFSIGYISGYSILRNNDLPEKLDFLAKSETINIITDDITSSKRVEGIMDDITSSKRVEGILGDIKNVNKKLLFLPIWSIDCYYKGNKYLFYFNGVTRKDSR